MMKMNKGRLGCKSALVRYNEAQSWQHHATMIVIGIGN